MHIGFMRHTKPPRRCAGCAGENASGCSALLGAVGKIFVVPAGALPVPVSERLYRLKTPNFLRPKPFYCRPRPAAQLLTICGCAVLFGQEELDDALCHGACVPGKRAGQVGSHGGLHKSKAELMYPGA